MAAVEPDSSPAYLNAFRYDAYGKTCGTWHASAGSLTVPWRFQGRMLESSSASPATDLYDFGARSYDPSLGAFTSFDSVSGSAQNPLTLNRYLYANANPATLVDPSGHSAQSCYEVGDCTAADRTGIGGAPGDGGCVYHDCTTPIVPKTSTGGDPTLPSDANVRTDAYGHCLEVGSPVWYCRDILNSPTEEQKAAEAAAFLDAVDRVSSYAPDCSYMSARECETAWMYNIRDKLEEMCQDAHGSGPACSVHEKVMPSVMAQLKAGLHVGLAIASFLPDVGPVFALANSGLYAAEGDWGNAVLWAIPAVPFGKIAAAWRGVRAGEEAAAAGGTASVGRWMSNAEYQQMVTSGLVQEGKGGRTYVVMPADPALYPAGNGVFVQFEVPGGSVYPASKPEWGVIPGPNAGTARYGTLPDEMPSATCIVLVCRR